MPARAVFILKESNSRIVTPRRQQLNAQPYRAPRLLSARLDVFPRYQIPFHAPGLLSTLDFLISAAGAPSFHIFIWQHGLLWQRFVQPDMFLLLLCLPFSMSSCPYYSAECNVNTCLSPNLFSFLLLSSVCRLSLLCSSAILLLLVFKVDICVLFAASNDIHLFFIHFLRFLLPVFTIPPIFLRHGSVVYEANAR